MVVAKEFAPNPPSVRTCNVHEVAADEMILDVGPAAVEALADVLKTCRTLVWNGPLGAFETPPFDAATVALAKTAAALTKEGSLVSVAGGGDTVAALNHAGVAQDFTFVSTAGGAFLEWMEGRTLPGVAALEQQQVDSMNQSDMTAEDRAGRRLHRRARPVGRIHAQGARRATASRTAHGRATRRCSTSSTRCARGSSPRPASAAARSSARSCSSGRWTATVDGKPVPQALIDRGIVPFIKIDKGLEDEENGVQMMKPMPELDALARARQGARRVRDQGALGDQRAPTRRGIAVLVAQQFQVAKQVLAHGLMPIIEPEVNIKSADRAQSDELLLAAILEELDEIPDGQQVMLKLSIPAEAGPVRAAGRPSQGAARGRAVGRLLARRSLPRAGARIRA